MKLPRLTTDDQVAAFLDQDLSTLDFSRFKPLRVNLITTAESGAEFKAELDWRIESLDSGQSVSSTDVRARLQRKSLERRKSRAQSQNSRPRNTLT